MPRPRIDRDVVQSASDRITCAIAAPERPGPCEGRTAPPAPDPAVNRIPDDKRGTAFICRPGAWGQA